MQILLALDERLAGLHSERMKEPRPEGIGPGYSADT
jgi:hypothetical protein